MVIVIKLLEPAVIIYTFKKYISKITPSYYLKMIIAVCIFNIYNYLKLLNTQIKWRFSGTELSCTNPFNIIETSFWGLLFTCRFLTFKRGSQTQRAHGPLLVLRRPCLYSNRGFLKLRVFGLRPSGFAFQRKLTFRFSAKYISILFHLFLHSYRVRHAYVPLLIRTKKSYFVRDSQEFFTRFQCNISYLVSN